MNAKRIGALLVAILLIVVALLVRSVIDDNDDTGTEPGTTSGTGGGSASPGYTIICSTEFTVVCNELAANLGEDATITIEPAGDTLDRLAKADASTFADAWLTLDPFPGMLGETRALTNFETVPATVTSVGVAAPVLTMTTARSDALQATCAGARVWRCVGDNIGTPWADLGTDTGGVVKTGLTDPSRAAGGLVTLGSIVAGYFDSADLPTNPTTDDFQFAPWVKGLARSSTVITDGSNVLDTLLRRQAFNIAATDSAAVTRLTDAQRANLTILDVSPAVAFTAVITRFTDSGDTGDTVADQVRALLAAAGWQSPSADATTLPATTFIALRALWKDNT